MAREGTNAAARRGRVIAAGVVFVAASAFALGLVVGLMIGADGGAVAGAAQAAPVVDAAAPPAATDPTAAAAPGSVPASEGSAAAAPQPAASKSGASEVPPAAAQPAPAGVPADPRAAFALAALGPSAWELDAGGYLDPADAQAVAARIAAAGPDVFGPGGAPRVRMAAVDGAPPRTAVRIGPFRGFADATAAATAVRRIVGVHPLIRPAGSAP